MKEMARKMELTTQVLRDHPILGHEASNKKRPYATLAPADDYIMKFMTPLNQVISLSVTDHPQGGGGEPG